MRLELDTWAQLSRSERRALLQIFAGGSLRSASEPTINGLRGFNLVSQEDELTMRGLNVIQAVARSDHQRRIAA
jgi:hypothetical protein